ncbi:hypothetical protein LTR78_008455 [Recurvomyces mirabilis]|uniref:Uncharacterized protein n=1 Tax=Recurvomyces mirabilis TaxID=574656 RepID=A0AAE0TQ79_9PEZI|nr:hypothetical protein LTR78_008455 [Recurvomyces mirabilis]KAK5155443.1 hypothetical protein LTS14_005704 [Recurvomyces mirabilis]
MDHRTRASNYATQLAEATSRIVELEGHLADCLAELESHPVPNTSTALPPQNIAIPTPTPDPSIKIENDTAVSHGKEIDNTTLLAENASLTNDLRTYTTFLNTLEEETGVAAEEFVRNFAALTSQIDSAKGIEAAQGQQIRTLRSKVKKQAEEIEKVGKERDQAVKEARKCRTDVRRWAETGMKAARIKDIKGSSATGGTLGSATVSAASSPMAETPRTTSLGAKRRLVATFRAKDYDDEEEGVPLK